MNEKIINKCIFVLIDETAFTFIVRCYYGDKLQDNGYHKNCEVSHEASKDANSGNCYTTQPDQICPRLHPCLPWSKRLDSGGHRM